MNKPHKGTFVNWTKRTVHPDVAGDDNLGWYYRGVFLDHPQFGGTYGYTSMVVKETEMENGDIEIETLNSRYTLSTIEKALGAAIKETFKS